MISVIVPVYNVERYLRCCIDSVITQTYNDLEIILIDDESTDDCGQICDEYAAKDERVIVIHKKNGGLSDARNTGINIAKGEYLFFIDSDDWMQADAIELLYNNLVSYDADISVCSYYLSYLHCDIPLYDEHKVFVFNSEQAIQSCFNSKEFTVSACGKLYKRFIFDEIRYPIGKNHEDTFVIVDVLSKASVIAVDTTPKLNYRQRKGSIMNDGFSPNTMHFIEACEHSFEVIQGKYSDLSSVAKERLLKAYLGAFHTMVFSSGYKHIPDYTKVLTTLRENYRIIMNSSSFTRNEKIKVKALVINVKLFKFLQSTNDWIKKSISGKARVLFD